MFARLRPAVRAVRATRVRAYTASPVMRAAQQSQQAAKAAPEEAHEGGKHLLLVAGATAAFVAAAVIVLEGREKRVHPSEPKEEEDAEEAQDVEVEAVAEVVGAEESVAAAALEKLEEAAAIVDTEIQQLVAAAEAALGIETAAAAAGAVASALPDPSEAASQGAFNEETGEINWDCPCLGGMAHGPCGEEFKAAFSCFVYSEQDPKGIDCVEKFKGMQECFRAHPDVYAEEIDDDEEAQAAAKE